VFVVDTNVLVYAAHHSSAEYETCASLLARWREDSLPWYSTWSIFYEFLRVVTHRKVLARPWSLDEAWAFLEGLVETPSFSLLVPGPRHAALARKTFTEHPDLGGNILHDVHTAVLMREHGVRRIVTRDRGFDRFPFVERMDPFDELRV
jgi:uncharacterized protein